MINNNHHQVSRTDIIYLFYIDIKTMLTFLVIFVNIRIETSALK